MREPLVHFLVGGAALFVLHGWIARGGTERPDRIVVSEQRIENLAATFARTWLRPPTRQELAGLIDDFVLEEMLYREALALGLDRDDVVVRRRMRQKMEFLSEDLSAPSEPSDEALRAYLEAHAEAFRQPGSVSFEQRFVRPEASGGQSAEQRAVTLLERLRGDPAPAEGAEVLGDATLLPPSLAEATGPEIDGTFGAGFARALAGLPVGRWSGPIASSYGLHLIRLAARDAERLPTLEEIRARVETEWDAERRREANRRFYESLRERYEVELRLPEAALPRSLAASGP